jgi:hypothetical protein
MSERKRAENDWMPARNAISTESMDPWEMSF